MRALIVDPAAPAGMSLIDDAPDPVPARGELLVDVHHVSLNAGDLSDARSGRLAPGAVLGSDLAGIVAVAADGSSLEVGARVVALAPAAFAERVLVDASEVAEVPSSVELAVAAALPVAGLAAMRSLRAAGPAVGRTVLITGASGGVGRFAVQLATRDGAHVIASVGSPERQAGLRELGADEVVVGLDGITERIDIVLDTVGGPQMVAAWSLLAADGSLQSIGSASGEPAVFPPYSTIGPAKSLTAFLIGDHVGADLAVLVDFVAQGVLTVEIGWQGGFDQIAAAVEVMRGRQINGKAVLDVRTGDSPERRAAVRATRKLERG